MANQSFVCFLGPFHGKMTGQRNCLEASYNGYEGCKACLSLGGEGLNIFSKIKFFTASFLEYLFILFRHIHLSRSTLYMTPSRSDFGFLRELPFLILSGLFGVKVLAHWHGADFEPFLNGRFAKIKKSIYSLVGTHIVLTESMKKEFEQVIDSRTLVIPNFHEREGCYECSGSFSKVIDKVRILYLSNLIPEKGVVDLLEAVEPILNSRLELYVVGAETDTEFTQSLDRYFSHPQVNYLGSLFGSAKNLVLENSDILVFPSYYPTEAFPLVYLEAISYATSVIAYDHNYLSDFFNMSGGTLVTARDIETLRQEILMRLKDTDLLLKEKSSNFEYSKSFTKSAYQSRINQLFD